MIDQCAPRVVHAGNPKAGVITRLASPRDGPARTVQLTDPPPARNPYVTATRFIRAHRFAITETSRDAWAHALHDDDVSLVWPGVDAAALVERAARGAASGVWRQAGIEATGGERIVMVARLQAHKGVHDFVDVAERVLERRPEASFLLVGPDAPMEPGVRAALTERIRARFLDGRVALAGQLSDEDLAAVVADATLLVHPVPYETFGLAVVEALALSTPVVAYSAPGPDVILRGGGGRVVTTGDTDALAAAALRVLDDPVSLEQWSRQAPAVAARFAIDAMADAYESEFERIASRFARR